ncbi:spore coat protein U domain-containing protein [Psychrobacter sp. P2G3]|uniref:Csu type fimbrial protein n=1 Tax=Psychrobacter sp. P2G3 TaxID=1699622 RepID=UPI00082B840A|nr:spore coat protein U domain-containing protein [Psychrobacter sp. P2G3]
MKLLRWKYSLFLIVGAWWLPMDHVWAGSLLRTECTASMTPSLVNIGDKITLANINNATITTRLDYTCTNGGFRDGYVSVCLAVGDGDYIPIITNPRYMRNKSDTNSSLAFAMTIDNKPWGARNDGSEYNTGPLIMPRRPGLAGTESTIRGSVFIDVSLLANNALATPGTYTNNFNSNHTALTYKADEDLNSSNCATESQNSIRFPFTVQATVIPSCSVTSTTDVNLGSHSANRNNIMGNNSSAIGVTCTNGAPYNIGLMPSNNSIDGAGVMSGTGSNTDKIPYQLHSTDGASGNIWGNTATSNNVGNGVVGTGDGTSQLKTVYVTVPSADFKPDNYSDIVSINVNY